jgi:hypothetical protein
LHEKKKDGKAQRLLQVLGNGEGLAECRTTECGKKLKTTRTTRNNIFIYQPELKLRES